jgi:hypothetical protein
MSTDLISEYNLPALLSGDDAFEELFSLREYIPSLFKTNNSIQNKQPTFGIHMNLSSYVYTDNNSKDIQKEKVVLTQFGGYLNTLIKEFGLKITPLVIGAYMDQRIELEDSLGVLKKTKFMQYFPKITFLDLPDSFIQNSLAQAAISILQCRSIITTSYHVSLFSKILGIPIILLAFNNYYFQKKQGLAQKWTALSEFLSIDPDIITKNQQIYVSNQENISQQWINLLQNKLSKPPQLGNSRIPDKSYFREEVISLASSTEHQSQTYETEMDNLNAQILGLEKKVCLLEQQKELFEG